MPSTGPSTDFRHLRSDRLIETAEKLAARVFARFPDAGLSHVASEVAEICRNAVAKADSINTPIWWLRISLIAFSALTLAFGIGVLITLTGDPLKQFLDFTRQAGPALVYLGAGVVFLVTLETRWKRWRAVKAIHELRAVAHIIDMHQLAKSPDHIPDKDESLLAPQAMRHYLQFCTEMLAILSKIGQLYVQDFPDGVTLASVDQFENLSTGLSQKMWQKLMVLDDVTPPPPA